MEFTTFAAQCSRPYIILSYFKGFQSSAEAGNANMSLILELFGNFISNLVEIHDFSSHGALGTIKIA